MTPVELDAESARLARWARGDATVTVIGLGKIGLPLAAQFASAGWRVIGVDVLPEVVRAVDGGGSHIEEPGIAELLASAHQAGRLRATTSHAEAAADADVIVMVVPVMLTKDHAPDLAWMDEATEAVAAGLRPGSLVIYETTLPVGATRNHFRQILEQVSGLAADSSDGGFYLAFSPERVFGGRILQDLGQYPKLVGGIDSASGRKAVAFYQSVLEAEVWDLGSAEAAELAKLAETTYRDVNIAFANELARHADAVGVDVLEVIRAANSQPYSHIHQPGIGVGGHCIPVYPHFLLASDPDLALVREARRVNDAQVERAIREVEHRLGPIDGETALILGLTYRQDVNETAYSRAIPLIDGLRRRGAHVAAYDPLLDEDHIARLGAKPYRWGEVSDASILITQTADRRWLELDTAALPKLRLVLDGRNSLDGLRLPPRVEYVGIGRKREALPS